MIDVGKAVETLRDVHRAMLRVHEKTKADVPVRPEEMLFLLGFVLGNVETALEALDAMPQGERAQPVDVKLVGN